MAKRGDLDSAITLANEFGVHKEWVIVGYILGGGEDYKKLERELSTFIRRGFGATQVVKYFINHNSDLLFAFLDEYPRVAQRTLDLMLGSSKYREYFPLIMEIRRRYPVQITPRDIGIAITHNDIEFFETLLSFAVPPNARDVTDFISRAIHHVQNSKMSPESERVLDYILEKYRRHIYDILRSALINNFKFTEILPTLVSRGLINQDQLRALRNVAIRNILNEKLDLINSLIK